MPPINKSLMGSVRGVKAPSSPGMQVKNPWERFLILFGAVVTIPRRRSLLPFRAAGQNTMKRSLLPLRTAGHITQRDVPSPRGV